MKALLALLRPVSVLQSPVRVSVTRLDGAAALLLRPAQSQRHRVALAVAAYLHSSRPDGLHFASWGDGVSDGGAL